MRTLTLALLLLPQLRAAEAPREYPPWDGHESVAAYAQRVNLPPTKQLDLGNGVKIELVLIPAGQFIMGTSEPSKPSITVASAQILLGVGGVLALLLLLVLAIKVWKTRKLSFSLRWLLLFTAACGLLAGGWVRWHLALQEASRFAAEMACYQEIHPHEERPHSVTLMQPYYMGKYPVTQAQYQALTGGNPSVFRGAQLPVDTVSWNDANAFCARLNRLFKDESLKANLPTEAQWEFGCRAGTQTRFYSGDRDGDLDAVGWYDANSGGKTHPVGTKKPNAFGLYDMHGNIWQWCRDAYMEHDELSATDPFNDKGEARVVHGGSCLNPARHCRSADRSGIPPQERRKYIGFRIVILRDL